MKFVCYSHWHQLPDSANQLFKESEQDSLFLSRMWFENITAHAIDDHNSLCLACVIENDTCLAILPLMNHSDGSLSSLSSRFTSLFSLIIISRHREQDGIVNCLAHGLAQLPAKPIHFEPIKADDINMQNLIDCMQTHGLEKYPYFRFHNWVHELTGESFSQYMSSRPSQLRNTVQRKQRKLQREHDYTFKLYVDSNIEQALDDYKVVYTASWKANEFHTEFTPNLVKQAAQLNWLRLGILYIDQHPIAAQIWFVVYNKANIYRLVYDEKWKQYSAGSILTYHLMQHVIDMDIVTVIDFLTGNEHYKRDWMSTRKEFIGVRLIKRNKRTSWIRKKYYKLIKRVFAVHQ